MQRSGHKSRQKEEEWKMSKQTVRVNAEWLEFIADAIRIHANRAAKELATGVSDDNPTFSEPAITSLLHIANSLERAAND